MTNQTKLKIAFVPIVLLVPVVFGVWFYFTSLRFGDMIYLAYVFPFAMIWMGISFDIDLLVSLLVLIQFPAYAIVLLFARSTKAFFVLLLSLVMFHAFAVFGCFFLWSS